MNTQLIIGIFNFLLGLIFLSIGLKIYKPKMKEGKSLTDWIPFYIMAGLGLIGWGLFSFF